MHRSCDHHVKKPPKYVDAEVDPTIKPTRDLSKLR